MRERVALRLYGSSTARLSVDGVVTIAEVALVTEVVVVSGTVAASAPAAVMLAVTVITRSAVVGSRSAVGNRSCDLAVAEDTGTNDIHTIFQLALERIPQALLELDNNLLSAHTDRLSNYIL